VYTVLFALVIFATPSTPGEDASTAKIIHFYSTHRGGMRLQVYLLAYCGVFAVVFFAVLTNYLRRHGANVLARVGFAGSVVVATAFGIGAAASDLLTHKSSTLTPADAQALNLINNDLPFIALFVGLLLAMISTGVAVLGTKALPTWMGWVAIVCGVAAGLGSFVSWIGLMLAGLWILVASIMLYQRMNAEGAAAMPAGGSGQIPAQGQPQGADSTISG
jgi:hypothetical protein